MKLQVTLFCKDNKYRPISTVVDIISMQYYEDNKAEVQKKAILNICHNRHTSYNILKKQGYTLIKIREYNQEKIKEQKDLQEKIALIKKLQEKRKKL